MPVYEYLGYDSAGKKATGVIDADSPKSARVRLKTEGVVATKVAVETTRGEFLKDPTSFLARRITAKDIATFTRQLATLDEGGLSLTESLDALIEQAANPRFKKVITDIRATVLQGGSLADAISLHKNHFDDLYINLVRAGEASGSLGDTLFRLAALHETRLKQTSKVTAAMIYPAIMTFVGSVVLIYLFTSVIPEVRTMFEDMQAALPLPTVILLAISEFLTSWWLVIVLALCIIALGFDRWRRTKKGKSVIDQTIISLPLFGNLVRYAAISRFSRSLSVLLTGGVALIESLKVTSTIIGHTQLSEAIDQAIINITEGQAITTPLKSSGLFPPLVTQMIAAGERSGSLPTMLEKIADAYEFEVENAISAMTTLIEPIMILLMGVVVGFIVLSILLPIFELSQIAQ